MYNRYIPQPDGTYRRNAMQEPVREPPKPSNPPRQEPVREENSCAPEVPPCQKGQPCTHMRPPSRPMPPRPKKNTQGVSIGSFLKQLIPRDFDTEDLIIVLLLLLMAGDCQEDQNSALLTLFLYLFM